MDKNKMRASHTHTHGHTKKRALKLLVAVAFTVCIYSFLMVMASAVSGDSLEIVPFATDNTYAFVEFKSGTITARHMGGSLDSGSDEFPPGLTAMSVLHAPPGAPGNASVTTTESLKLTSLIMYGGDPGTKASLTVDGQLDSKDIKIFGQSTYKDLGNATGNEIDFVVDTIVFGKDYTFEVVLPTNNAFEIDHFVFNLTGVNDGDTLLTLSGVSASAVARFMDTDGTNVSFTGTVSGLNIGDSFTLLNNSDNNASFDKSYNGYTFSVTSAGGGAPFIATVTGVPSVAPPAPPPPEVPETGTMTNVIIWSVVAGSSLLGIIIAAATLVRKRKEI